MESQLIVVRVRYDVEAAVWFIQGSDLPGLAAEAATIEALSERLPGLITDLIEENGLGPEGNKNITELVIEIIASRQARVHLRPAA